MSDIEVIAPFAIRNFKDDIIRAMMDVWDDHTDVEATATAIRLASTGGDQVLILKGSGFEVDAQGHMTGGTITGITMKIGNQSVLGIAGIAIPLAQFADTLDEQRRTEVADLFTAMDFTGSSGDDSIVGTGGSDVFEGRNGDDLFTGRGGGDAFVGGNGLDVVSYLLQNSAVTVNLHDPSQNRGAAAGDSYDGIEGIFGSAHDDTLMGNGLRNGIIGMSGDDVMFGNRGNDFIAAIRGNDTLIGGQGRDELLGGSGRDTFVYTGVDDSTVARDGRDNIGFFNEKNEDTIDVSQIDAIAGGSDNAFVFIGEGEFTGLGQIRAIKAGFNTLIEFNISGNNDADMAIMLEGNHLKALGAGDFTL